MLKKFWNLFSAPDSKMEADMFPFDSSEFYQDPYPYYQRLREKAPFYLSNSNGIWVLSRYRDVVDALSHPSLGNAPSRFSTLHDSKSNRFICANVANNIMPFLDGPRHRDQRKLLAKIFTLELKRIEPILPEIAERHVDNLTTEIEAVQDLGTPFAMDVICEILGIPTEDILRKWSNHFFYLFTQIPSAAVREQVDQSLSEFRAWLKNAFADVSAGLLGQLKTAINSGDIPEAVAIDSTILFFADGLENVDSGIGNLFHVFANHPTAWAGLRENPALIDTAVSECLRYESPAQYIARTCIEDLEWKGNLFKKNTNIVLLLGSANRDPNQFDKPDLFDLTRTPNRHVSFGLGRHSCLGGTLVELEFSAILKALTARFSKIESAGTIRWQKRKGHRWIEEGRFLLTSQ